MKLYPQHIAVLALVALLMGCATQQHPIERGIAIDRSFGQAVSWINWGLRHGYISKEQGQRIAPHINAGNALIIEMKAEIAAGGDGSKTAEKIIPHLEAVLRAQVEVERARETVERVSKSATKPSTK